MEDKLKPHRIGRALEYKQGHHYMTIIEWEDGHCDIEVQRVVPELLFYSCDNKDKPIAKNIFNKMMKLERIEELKRMNLPKP